MSIANAIRVRRDWFAPESFACVETVINILPIDNCGKAFQGALYLNVWFAEIAGKLFEKFIKQVPTTFDTLAKADMVVFYCVLGVARSPTTVVEYQKAVASSLGRNKDQLVVLLDGGMTAYNNQPQPVLSMWRST